MSKLLTVYEFAKLKDVTANYVYQLLYCGKIAGARKDGKQWRIPVSAQLPSETK